LEKSIEDKYFPEQLYEIIKFYLVNQLTYDHYKLIAGFDFFYQLKPDLRYSLVLELFPSFLNDFSYMFKYEEKEFYCGNEFLSNFVSLLKCRIFVSD
jgi:predicted AlkP superfamily pyrophosphatase or phosphodiesterase